MNAPRLVPSLVVVISLAAFPVVSLASPPEQGKGPLWRAQDATPQVRFTIKEFNRLKVAGKVIVKYGLETYGFPEGKSYGLWLWNFGDPDGWLMMKDFSTDPAGRLVCEHPIPPQEAEGGKNRSCVLDMEKLSLSTGASVKGMPFRAAVLSTDGSVKAFARAVPLPLQSKQRGCTISAELASEKADAFLVEGEGFAPGEKVAWTAEVGGDVTEDEAAASENGKFVVALNPGATGKDSGKIAFTARGKSCAPLLIFKWGPPALQ